MERRIHTVIDAELCTGCGECVRVCPSRTITLVDGKARVTGKDSLNCGHCEVVCPTDAIQVTSLHAATHQYASFKARGGVQAPGEGSLAELAQLMGSRRSCRNYKSAPVARAQLDDLVKLGQLAPSGTNCQHWTFTVLPTRADVGALGTAVQAFFKRLCTLARNAPLRLGLQLVGQPALATFHRDYLTTVEEAMEEYERLGRDRLFHGATAAILVGSRPGASTAREDALLATQNIVLAAHAMGLGTCLIGFVVEAMRHDKSIGPRIGIPRGEPVYAVIALGHPDESYLAPARRMLVEPRTFTASAQ